MILQGYISRSAQRISRRGLDKGPIDDALKPFGLERAIATIVGGFSSALALARASDLIASVPERQTETCARECIVFPSGPRASGHDFIALAPADGSRSRASLVARSRSGYLRGDPLKGSVSRSQSARAWTECASSSDLADRLPLGQEHKN
jgi:hypothetical protein